MVIMVEIDLRIKKPTHQNFISMLELTIAFTRTYALHFLFGNKQISIHKKFGQGIRESAQFYQMCEIPATALFLKLVSIFSCRSLPRQEKALGTEDKDNLFYIAYR